MEYTNTYIVYVLFFSPLKILFKYLGLSIINIIATIIYWRWLLLREKCLFQMKPREIEILWKFST